MSYNKANERNYSDDELRALERKLLEAVATYNGIATKASPALRALCEKKKVLPGDTLKAWAIMNSSDYKTNVHIRPDAYVNTHGGWEEYTPTTVTHTDLHGKEQVRDNLPVPLPFNAIQRYDNLVAVTVFCAQLVKNEAGTWQSAVNTASWRKVYASGVSPVGVQTVASLVVDYLSADSYWIALTPAARNGIQGPEMLSFIALAFNRLPERQYYALNCNIVLYGITAMTQKTTLKGLQWVVVKDDKGKPVVPPTVWEAIDANEVTRPLITDDGFPAVLKYNGGLPIAMHGSKKTGTLKSAILALQLLREVQGGDNTASAMLSAMRGYSGMTDEFGRRIQFIISSVLAVWDLGRPATVQLSSIGDLAILISSLNHWRRQILMREGERTLKMQDSMMQFSESTMRVKFMVPGIHDRQKITGNVASEIVTAPLEDSIVIMYNPGNLPTATEKGKAVDFESTSKNIIPHICYDNDFILYTIIFGDYPFPTDPEVIRARRSMTATFRPLQWKNEKEELVTRELYVYRHGTASGFRGVLSSIEDLELVGYGHPPNLDERDGTTVIGYDMTQKMLHNIPLVCVDTQAKWYDRVVMDCEAQSVIFGNPVVRYSGISNLVRQSKAAAALNLSLVPLEDGMSAGMLTLRRRHVVDDEVIDFTRRTGSSAKSPLNQSVNSSQDKLIPKKPIEVAQEQPPKADKIVSVPAEPAPASVDTIDDDDVLDFGKYNNYGQVDDEAPDAAEETNIVDVPVTDL